jgi:hypothetical protein
MRLVCSWCKREKKSSLIAEVDPRDNPEETHGLCEEHRRHVVQQLQQDERPPDVEV